MFMHWKSFKPTDQKKKTERGRERWAERGPTLIECHFFVSDSYEL